MRSNERAAIAYQDNGISGSVESRPTLDNAIKHLQPDDTLVKSMPSRARGHKAPKPPSQNIHRPVGCRAHGYAAPTDAIRSHELLLLERYPHAQIISLLRLAGKPLNRANQENILK